MLSKCAIHKSSWCAYQCSSCNDGVKLCLLCFNANHSNHIIDSNLMLKTATLEALRPDDPYHQMTGYESDISSFLSTNLSQYDVGIKSQTTRNHTVSERCGDILPRMNDTFSDFDQYCDFMPYLPSTDNKLSDLSESIEPYSPHGSNESFPSSWGVDSETPQQSSAIKVHNYVFVPLSREQVTEMIAKEDANNEGLYWDIKENAVKINTTPTIIPIELDKVRSLLDAAEAINDSPAGDTTAESTLTPPKLLIDTKYDELLDDSSATSDYSNLSFGKCKLPYSVHDVQREEFEHSKRLKVAGRDYGDNLD